MDLDPGFLLNHDPDPDPDPDLGFWWLNKFQLKKNLLDLLAIYLFLGIHGGLPRSLQPSNENIYFFIIFACLDPDPNPETQLIPDPDPETQLNSDQDLKHWK